MTCMPVGSINGIIILNRAFKQPGVDPKVVEEIYFSHIVLGQPATSCQATSGAGMSPVDDATKSTRSARAT